MSKNTLPSVAAAEHPVTGVLIMVMKDRLGYWLPSTIGIVDETMTADKWNTAHGISKAESEAMLAGSLFGFDIPAADPANYDAAGNLSLKKCLDDRSIV
jgi:hypothetical protein